MFPLRIALIFVWFSFASFVGLFMALFRWKDLDVDHDIARLISGVGLRLARVRVRYEGPALESVQPCIYVANHQHGIDVLTFGSVFPKRTIVIGKKELLWIPFFGLAFYASGNILVDRSNRTRAVASLGRAVARIRAEKASIIVFPEGTRNRTGTGLLPFKKGAFHMAVAAQIPIVPLVCSPVTGVARGSDQDTEVVIRALEPVPTAGLQAGDLDKLMTQVRGKMVEAFLGLGSNRP